MNIRRGLQRISAVWWSLVFLFGMAGASAVAYDKFRANNTGGGVEALFIGLVAASVVALGLHKVTCWVIAGFASDGSNRQ